MLENLFKMQYIFIISLVFLISINYVNSECGCKKTKRIFGTEIKDGVCFYTDFLTIIQHPITRNMAKILGGVYHIGTDNPVLKPDGEGPRRPVQLFDYYIDKFEVSVSDFAKFINATGYRTDADRYGDSFVLYSLVKNLQRNKSVSAVATVPWWLQINGTNWAHPEGPNSTIKGRWDHPVVHVSWNDAITYCSWLGKRLPTEAEWEVACRGSLENKLFAWGDEFLIDEKHQANTWQGFFPFKNTKEDGYINTAPVDAFLQNQYGLYNMIGNVWEWTNDWWETKHSTTLKVDPKGPETGTDKVKKGGSFMCHKDYCYRFRCAARSQNTVESTSGNMGFRCAKSAIN